MVLGFGRMVVSDTGEPQGVCAFGFRRILVTARTRCATHGAPMTKASVDASLKEHARHLHTLDASTKDIGVVLACFA